MNLPNPGIEPGSPAFQVVSLPTQLPGNPMWEAPRKYSCSQMLLYYPTILLDYLFLIINKTGTRDMAFLSLFSPSGLLGKSIDFQTAALESILKYF